MARRTKPIAKIPPKRTRQRGDEPGRSLALAPVKPRPSGVREYNTIEPHKIPEAIWEIFLQELSERGHITDSAIAAGIKRLVVYNRRDADAEFASRMKAAHQRGLEQLEDIAIKRVREGVTNKVYQGGKPVGEVTTYSDDLMKFLLTGNMPKYRKSLDIGGPGGTPLLAEFNKLDDSALGALIEQKLAELNDATAKAKEASGE